MKTQDEYKNGLDPLQISLADKIYNLIPKEVTKIIEYDNCTIDIIVNVGNVEKHTTLAQGRFRVFWDRSRNYKIGYLPAGLLFWDGYEVLCNRWVNDISLTDVITLLNKDISENRGR